MSHLKEESSHLATHNLQSAISVDFWGFLESLFQERFYLLYPILLIFDSNRKQQVANNKMVAAHYAMLHDGGWGGGEDSGLEGGGGLKN